MKVNGKPQRTIWVDSNNQKSIHIIDQTHLPHQYTVVEIKTVEETFRAIADMQVRGAPLIGITAAFGMYLAAIEAQDSMFDSQMQRFSEYLISARPTAVNLAWAVRQQLEAMHRARTPALKRQIAFENACRMADQDIETCRKIGEFGLTLIAEIYKNKKSSVNILTHCNAGWLACVDWGTATSPVYHAFLAGIPIHVWVDETRPRNQGASLTAWELNQQGVPHTLIADNTGGHLMQRGEVDLVIVGTDRTTRSGDVANKIGTYLKALAAHDNQIPFYVAAPSSSIDWNIHNGLEEIIIEERDAKEVKRMSGLTTEGKMESVLICPPTTRAVNYAFDITPARLVTGIITERGICKPEENDLLRLFPEMRHPCPSFKN